MITKNKRLFEKGYLPNWSYEQFTIVKSTKGFPTRYTVSDYNGENLEGTFYESELQKAKKRDVHQIEKVIRRRNGKALIKWHGYPDSFNQWVPAKDVYDLP